VSTRSETLNERLSPRACEKCGGEIAVPEYGITPANWAKRKFCGDCWWNGRRPELEPKTCETCGTEIKVAYKISPGVWEKRRFCSLKCAGGAPLPRDEAGNLIGRTCNDCQEWKTAENFRTNSGSKDGLYSICRPCASVRARKHYDANADKYRRNTERCRYGLTRDEHALLLSVKERGCMICGDTDKRMVIDHDHDTGAIRGILCDACNQAIGCLRDDPDLMANALEYILRETDFLTEIKKGDGFR
jgi:hypothetical protein